MRVYRKKSLRESKQLFICVERSEDTKSGYGMPKLPHPDSDRMWHSKRKLVLYRIRNTVCFLGEQYQNKCLPGHFGKLINATTHELRGTGIYSVFSNKTRYLHIDIWECRGTLIDTCQVVALVLQRVKTTPSNDHLIHRISQCVVTSRTCLHPSSSSDVAGIEKGITAGNGNVTPCTHSPNYRLPTFGIPIGMD